MKASELMIGDYCLVNTDVCIKKGTIVEICSVDNCRTLPSHNLKGSTICKPIDKDYSAIGGVWAEFLSPIPLQKLHVIKNGFEPVDEDDRAFVFSDGYRIEVVFDEGIPQMDIPPSIYLTIEFAEKELDMPIEYVHELQQAMRLLGVDKKIEL